MGRAERRAAERRDRRAARKILPPGMTTDLVERMNAVCVERYGFRIGEMTMREHRASGAVTRCEEALAAAPFGKRGGHKRRLRRAQEELRTLRGQLDDVARTVAAEVPEQDLATALRRR